MGNQPIMVSNELEFNQAIATVDAATSGGYTIDFTTTITEGIDAGGAFDYDGRSLSDLYTLNLASGVNVTIDGGGNALSGADAYLGLFVYSGDVTIKNLTIQRATELLAKGKVGD